VCKPISLVAGIIAQCQLGVLITGCSTTAEIDIVLERIITTARESISLDGQSLRMTVSLGVALCPDDAQTPKGLMQAADAAMYEVKRNSGDGYAYFDESMNRDSEARRVLRHQIDEAIKHRDFVMHYQPVVNARDGSVWGVEALVRWKKGDGTMVPAGEFIPFCEESGQIRELGMLTIALVAEDAASLRAAGHGSLRICVNVSVRQLQDRNFATILDRFPPPLGMNGLVVEILESVFLPNHSQALDVLGQLAELGAETAIDDYGSGYSNVSLLQTLKPDYIKLDRSFLSVSHTTTGRSALIRSAVEMSHVVGSLVIAESIEDEDQYGLVRDAGVDLVQGFAIARPMSLADLGEWLSVGAT
jgi:EAL domain-containing protein (putative c-di-GMP-specific phosphodiesterase class I)